MKKLLLLLFFLPAIFSEAQTSVYHPFPDSDAVWNVRDDIAVDQLGNYDNRYYSYTITGDTTIGIHSYHIIQVPFVETYAPYSNSWSYQTGYRAGYLRQDTVVKKVFFIYYGDTYEYILYDFNLNVGDTLPSNSISQACFYPPIYYPTVAGIDSILINGTYRKRWNINVQNTKYFIEGIGSTDGLLETICSPEDPWEFASLICFSQNGITLYPDSSSSCELLTKVQNLTSDNILISPNPARDYFTINQPGELKIYDAMGRLVFKDLTPDASPNGEGRTVRLVCEPGIYFVRLSDGKKVFTQKLIVQ